MIHLYDGNNVMLRDLEKIGHERLGLRLRYERANTPGEMHIWVWDGRNHNVRRQILYPAYKGKRTPMAEDRFAQIHVFREALQHSNAIQIECDGWEADDIIGSMVHRFASRQGGLSCTVHTNDLDYWQLMSYSNVTIDGIKMSGVPNCEPHHIPLYKALVGDPSDNIIGVPGFGPKSWNALTPPDRKKLLRAIEENSPELITELPLPTRPRNLLLNSDNRKEARNALAVTRFFPVPDGELDAGIKPGTLNRPAADALFRKFFL